MTAKQYEKLVSKLGTRAQVAAALGVDIGTVFRRISGALPITKEAALALASLGPTPTVAGSFAMSARYPSHEENQIPKNPQTRRDHNAIKMDKATGFYASHKRSSGRACGY